MKHEPAAFLKNEIDDRLEAMIQAVSNVRDDREILDIGDNNNGLVPNTLRARCRKVFTIDLEGADLNMDIDGKKFPKELNGRFGCVVAGEIIEHMIYTDVFMANVWESLELGGTFIFTFPNICCLVNRLRVPLGRFPIYGSSTVSDTNHENDKFHVRDFNLEQMKNALERNGFKISSVSGLGIYIRGKLLHNGLHAPATLSNQILIVSRKVLK